MSRSIIIMLLFMLISSPLFAYVKLPTVLADNMVLQQNMKIKFWGWAEPGEQITVSGDWLQSPQKTITDQNGNWQILLKTEIAGGPHSITIKGTNTIELKNILFGEVWVCSGQSNMEWPLSEVDNAEQEIADANYAKIRLFNIKNTISDSLLKDCEPSLVWSECNSATVNNFSAVAYFFARELCKELNVPIGLIGTNWGGTPVQAWTKMEIMESDEAYKSMINVPVNWAHHQPACLYNGMIHPIINYGIKGAIWYQGESNRNEPEIYEKLFPAMIKNWRDVWNQGDFPFYYVQIAPYNYDETLTGALLREAQFRSMKTPHTGMAVTMDIGNVDDIHPTNKQDVGKRLSLWALANTYNKKTVFSGPMYKSMKIEGDKIRLNFDYIGKGLKAKDVELDHFEISANDREFKIAKAVIDGENVIVQSSEIKQPVAVRYAFTNTAEASLFNNADLPASSFRTDDWQIVIDIAEISSVLDSVKDVYVKMNCKNKNAKIRYTFDGTEPNENSLEYLQPFVIKKSCKVHARAFLNNIPSVIQSDFEIFHHNGIGKEVHYKNECSKKYACDSCVTLVNGVKGSLNFWDGQWQGFKGNDLGATIDLGEIISIKSISTSFLQKINSWIFLPEFVEFAVSNDNATFQIISKIDNVVSNKKTGVIQQDFSADFSDIQAKYIQVNAKNIAICPEWHQGAGEKAWIFVDEIIVQ